MSSRAPDLLASIFSTDRPRGLSMRSGAISIKLGGVPSEPFDGSPQCAARRRTPIWDMHHSVHCSIIGTCLSAAELRRLLVKLGVMGADSADDHTLHKQAVTFAGKPQQGGKFIQKALDRRHETAIKQCARFEDEDSLSRFWEDSRNRGDIPGAYWAVLSHPAATERVMRQAFGDVHMLSHMIGAANRADIRRLRQLEEENAALTAKLEQQQRQLRDGFVARDEKIRQLTDALSRAAAQVSTEHTIDDVAAARTALADVGHRLSREVARHTRLETRIESLTLALAEAERGWRGFVQENQSLRDELALAESQVSDWLARDSGPSGFKAHGIAPATPQLAGTLVLYVGGRAHQVPQLKALVERAGGVFLHHDGGIENAVALLPGMISRADCAAFPIDCISHDAMATVKRLCRQSGKSFIPLRTSSLASLMSGLQSIRAASAAPNG